MDCLEELISAARGEQEVDLLLEGAEIVNTLSGEILELGEVGNVSLDLDNSSVSFQNLIPIETFCEGETPCIGNRYEPSGEILVKSLP
jgi:hypothetical protein